MDLAAVAARAGYARRPPWLKRRNASSKVLFRAAKS